MSSFEVAAVCLITVVFLALGAMLAWGWMQTKDLPKPVPWPEK